MTAPLRFDDRLIEWATPRQLELIEALKKYGSAAKASKALGVNRTLVADSLARLRRRAAQSGYSPSHDMTKTVPDGFMVRGVSTYYDDDGKVRGQWVKSSVDDEQRERIIKETVATLVAEVRGLAPATKPPKRVLDDLLAVYPMGDPHFGMYAWAQEAGEDFDLEIAKSLTFGAVDRLVQAAPAASVAIFLPLGDVLHMDDQTNRTPQHQHQLDADGRFVKVLRVAIGTFRHAILRLLEKHDRVVVRFKQGNHDPHAVWAIAFAISAFFDSEPRVEVDLTPAKHWFYRFGKVLIGATHGDTTKHEDLLGVMACDRAEDWGQTKHRYWYTGHVHHQAVREYPGVVCESFRTLAARDAYAAGYGYRAGRDMLCIIHHKEHGEIERHRCDIGMLQ